MTEQKRTIKTPCCDKRSLLNFPRGMLKGKYKCSNCGKLFIVEFKQGKNGRTGRIIKKEVLTE